MTLEEIRKLMQIDLDALAKRVGVERQRDAYGYESLVSFQARVAAAVGSKVELEEEVAFPSYGEEAEEAEAAPAVPEPPKEAEERDFLSSLAEI